MADSSSRKRPGDSESRPPGIRRRHSAEPLDSDAFLALLADADCTLLGAEEAPVLGSGDVRQLQIHLERRLGHDRASGVQGRFVSGLEMHIAVESNLRRILKPIEYVTGGNKASASESLARVLLNVPSIQIDVANLLLEKLPEYFSDDDSMTPAMESLPRLILAQFRWLDYVVDSTNFTEKLLQVLSICPLNLKKEIISFLPELVSDQAHATVMASLEQMLQEDLQIIVPVLDAFTNLNLDKLLYEQVVEIALSSLKSADAEDLPLIVRFLLQSATSENAKRIIHHLRDDLHFITLTDVRAARHDQKLKRKASGANSEALVVDALRSGVRFQNVICDAYLKELRSIEGERNHKVLDIWFLLILHANGGLHRKAVEALLRRKVLTRGITAVTLRKSIKGHGDSLQDYFQTLIAVSEAMLRSKEYLCTQFGMQMYILLFEEFRSIYHRQEVLGSLITHTGTGVAGEVNSALSTLCLFVDNYPYEMLAVSSFINGILDYLEFFPNDSLHHVYRIFSRLAVACRSLTGASSHSSVANDFLMFIRKQVTNPDIRYKRMGIIGVVNLLSCLETENLFHREDTFNEATGLLRMSLEMCKTSGLVRGFFYNELATLIDTHSTNSFLVDWASKHTCEFEAIFLGDLENGRVSVPQTRVEGELWMNLDGNASPVFLKLLPMLRSNDHSSLMFLCSNFRLLAAAERAANRGLLGSIDALLGCPLYLPKAEVFSGNSWTKLPRKLKASFAIAIFYAVNWMRELINAFSSQVGPSHACLTQSSLKETATKLIYRLRNLLQLEHILSECLKVFPNLTFPDIHSFGDVHEDRSQPLRLSVHGKPPKLKKRPKEGEGGESAESSQATTKLRQGTITDAFGKANRPEDTSQGQPTIPDADRQDPEQYTEDEQHVFEEANESRLEKSLGSQKMKLQPLHLNCLNLLFITQMPGATLSEVAVQIPVNLYLLRDLLHKLELCFPKLSTKSSSRLATFRAADVLSKVQAILPAVRVHLDTALSVLQQQLDPAEIAECWRSAWNAAGNPRPLDYTPNILEAVECLIYVVLRCLGKIVQCPQLRMQEDLSSLKELLEAFGEQEVDLSNLRVQPSGGSLEFLLCSACTYFETLLETAIKTSFLVGTETVKILKDLVDLAKNLNDVAAGSNRQNHISSEVCRYLSEKLSSSASKMVEHDWPGDESGRIWKGKHDVLHLLLRVMIEENHSPIELLQHLSSNVMTEVPAKGGKCTIAGYPALSTSTFVVWYRVQHEVVLELFRKVVKDILLQSKSKAPSDADRVSQLLDQAHQCIVVHVLLISLTRTHDKTAVHGVALRCGGKFVDTFLRMLDFLQASFESHKALIISMVKELQKATRTVQAICADAKGQKKLPVTCRIPAVKRSMERYVFCIKGLLHKTSGGDAFWMGNLKHKDLQGREIGSQLPVSDEEDARADSDAPEPGADDADNVQGDSSDEEPVSLAE